MPLKVHCDVVFAMGSLYGIAGEVMVEAEHMWWRRVREVVVIMRVMHP